MKKWVILFTICLVWLLTYIDLTAVNLALAPIARSLHSPLTTIQWIITAYVLCSAAFMAIGGRLGDMYGHRNLFIMGIFIFAISSAFAGFAPNVETLILGRVGQGIGLALVVPITTALVYLTFEPAQKGMALGFITGASGAGMALGPTIGGWLISYMDWRWIFFINIPICLLAIFLAWLLLPKIENKKPSSIDIPGMITLSLGLLLLLLAINQASNWGLTSVKFITVLILSILLLISFVIIENKKSNPLISLKMLANKTLLNVICIRMCTQYIFLVFLLVMALYLQNILGLPADKAGYVFLTTTILFGLIAPFAGKLSHYISLRYLISLSCLLMMLALFLLILTQINTSIPYLILPMVLIGIAYGIHFPTTNLAALKSVAPTQSALVTGLQYTLVFASASVGIVISAALLQSLSQNKLEQLLHTQNISLQSSQQQSLHSIASGAHTATSFVGLPKAAVISAQQGFMYGFHWVLLVCLCLATLALLFSLFLPTKEQISAYTQSE